MTRTHALLPLAAPLLPSGAAQAHQLWLEQSPASARLYYGEFDRKLREASPGGRAGQPYDVANFMTTLSLTQDQGLDALPAHPAATPGK
jgi:hypothetical protein